MHEIMHTQPVTSILYEKVEMYPLVDIDGKLYFPQSSTRV